MITDDDYTRAGLLPPGYVLRARDRETRSEYSKWTQECEYILDDDLVIPAEELIEWVDWQITIFFRVAVEEGCTWGNKVWWSVRQEASRRELLAAFKLEHDYISGGHPYKGKEWRGERIK